MANPGGYGILEESGGPDIDNNEPIVMIRDTPPTTATTTRSGNSYRSSEPGSNNAADNSVNSANENATEQSTTTVASSSLPNALSNGRGFFARMRKPDKTPLINRGSRAGSNNGAHRYGLDGEPSMAGSTATGSTTVETGDLMGLIQQGRPDGLSTFAGVFCPVALSMFSVLLFLRSGYVVGHAGVLLGLGMLLTAYILVGLTVLSLSAVSTNGAIEGGGVYYMISRALGPEFGGSIGTLFFLANVFSCALYIAGFVEALINNFGVGGALLSADSTAGLIDSFWMRFVYGFVISLFVLLVCVVGAKMFAKASILLFAIVMFCYSMFLLSFMIQWSTLEIEIPYNNKIIYTNETEINGTQTKQTANYTGFSATTLRGNLFPVFGEDYTTMTDTNFAVIFAVVFTGVTGIMAGANMSGELRKPAVSIPNGTLNAVFFTGVIYVFTVFLLGATCDSKLLNNNNMVIQDINVFPPFIAVAVFCCTLFAAMSNLIGASRVLERLADDRIFGSLLTLASVKTRGGNPVMAVILAWFLTVAVLLIGALNRIAKITSIFFLLSYLGVNLATLALDLASAPNFRPQFGFFSWHTSLLGGTGCVVMCFVVDPSMSGIAIILLLLLLMALHYKVLYLGQAPGQSWGSISQALIFHQVRKYLLLLDPRKEHVKYWRPQLLLLVKSPKTCCPLIDFVNDMKKSGLYVIGHIQKAKLEDYNHDPLHDDYPFWLSLIDYLKIKAFVELTLADSVREGVHQLMRLSGIGAMKPNTVVLGFSDNATPDNTLNRIPQSRSHGGRLDRAEVVEYFTSHDFPPQRRPELSLGIPTDDEKVTEKEYVGIIVDAIKLNKNVCLARHFYKLNKADIFRSGSSESRFVDVWPVDICQPIESGWGWDNSCLFLLQMACIVSMTRTWKRHITLRVFLCVSSLQDMHRRERQLKEMLGQLRISAKSLVVPWDHVICHLNPNVADGAAQQDQPPAATDAASLPFAYVSALNEMIERHSARTSVVFLNMPTPPKEEAKYEAYLDTMRRLTDKLPPTMLVHGLSSVISTAL